MASVGAIHVDVFPSTQGFVGKMAHDLETEADKLGKEIGQRLGKQIGKQVADNVTKGISDSRPEEAATRKGRATGGAFGRALRAEIDKTLASLPDVEIGADLNISEVELKIAEVRKELTELHDKSFTADFNAQDAIFQIEALKTFLDSIHNETVNVDVKFNLDQASRALTQLQRQMAADAGGNFDNTLRASLQRLSQDLPKIKLEADSTDAERKMEQLRLQVLAFSDNSAINLHIDADEALAEAARLRAEFEAILGDVNAPRKVRLDAADAIAALDALLAQGRRLDEMFAPAERAAGRFAATISTTLSAAIESLPDIDLGTQSAQVDLAALKATLESMHEDVQITLEMGGVETVLAQAAAVRASLEAVARDASRPIDIRLNAFSAMQELDRLQGAVDGLDAHFAALDAQVQEVEREVGKFARDLRVQVEAALRNLPDFEIGTTRAHEELASIRAELLAFADVKIGVDIDARDADRAIDGLIVRLQALHASTSNIQIKADTSAAVAELLTLRGVADTVAKDIDLNLGAVGRKLVTDLEAASKALPEIKIDADTSPALRQVESIRGQIAALAARVKVEGDTADIQAKIFALRAELRDLDSRSVDIRVRADVDQAITSLSAASAATRGIGITAAETADSMSQWELILRLCLALIPLIAGALLAVPAAVAAIGLPMGAVLLGLDGIKAAATALRAPFEQLRATVSATFQQSLGPSIQNIAALMPTLSVGLSGVAKATSQVANEITGMLASAEGVKLLQATFAALQPAIVALGPPITTFLENTLKLASIGGPAVAGFGALLQQLAVEFGQMIDKLAASGVAQAAMQAIFQILAAIVGLIGPLTQLGAVIVAAIGPALAAVLEGTTAALQLVGNILNALPGPAQVVATALITVYTVLALFPGLGATFAAFGSRVSLAFTAIQVGALTAAESLTAVRVAFATEGLWAGIAAGLNLVGGALRAILLALISNPIVLIITGIVVALTALAGAHQAAAQAEADHKQAVDSLTSALRESGGALDANVLQQIQAQLASRNLGDALQTMGISSQQAAQAVAQGGPAYDALIQRLQDVASRNGQWAIANGQTIGSVAAQANAASTLVAALQDLRSAYDQAMAQQAAYTQLLAATGYSLQGGLANAKQLSDAIGVLGKASSTTSEKVTALKAALDALNGGELTAEDAARKLNEQIDEIGKKMLEATGGSKALASSLVAADGTINTTTDAGRKLFDATTSIRDAMLESATAAFDAKGGLNNVEIASAAASQEVQRSRDAFIKAAEAAGLTAIQAAALADHYGLIPKDVVTTLEAKNAPAVIQDILKLAAEIKNVPPGKQVEVTALTDGAKAALEAVGIKITTLPDGKAVITVDDKTAPEIDTILKTISSQSAQIPTSLNLTQAQVDLDNQLALVNTAHGTMTIDGDPTLANGKTIAAVTFADGSKGTVIIDGNQTPANGKIDATVIYADGSIGHIKVDADPSAANAAIDNAARDRTSTIWVTYRLANGQSGTYDPNTGAGTGRITSGSQGYIATPMADGGVLRMAGGGLIDLTPMDGRLANVVPPNTWRVIGDRMSGEEAYIPINDSARSAKILQLTAQKMGYEVYRRDLKLMADGGLLTSTRDMLRFAQALRRANPSVSTQDTGSFLASGGASAAGTVLGTSRDGVKALERKLEAIAALLAERSDAPASITVEDKSGNPVETARAMQLALRLRR